MDAFLPCFRSALPEERLATLGTFRVLAALARPLWRRNAEPSRHRVSEQKGRIEAGAEHFDGRPILIVEGEPRSNFQW